MIGSDIRHRESPPKRSASDEDLDLETIVNISFVTEFILRTITRFFVPSGHSEGRISNILLTQRNHLFRYNLT